MLGRHFDREAHKRMVLEVYARTETPILIGPVSLLRGWHGTILETEEILEEMVQDSVRFGYFLRKTVAPRIPS